MSGMPIQQKSEPWAAKALEFEAEAKVIRDSIRRA